MKKEVGVIVLFLIAFSLVCAIDLPVLTDAPLSGTSLVITALSYEPYPVSPGEQFELQVKIEPKGSETIQDATCRIETVYPFSIYLDTPIRSYGKMAPGDIATFKFNLKVDERAVQGENEIKLWCTENPASNYWIIQKINITIQSRYPSLNIKEVKTTPEVIAPGQEGKISFILENQASSYMKDINIKLDLSSVDIVPYGEISEKKLNLISPNEISEVNFAIKPLPTAKGGLYKIPFVMTYTDNLGTAYNQTGILSIGISSPVELISSIDSTTIYESNSIGEVNIKVINPSLTDIKYATLEILPSDKFKLLSSNIIYIGDIDSDDSSTATFKISVKTWSKTFDIPLKITYKDALNKEFIQESTIPFTILSAKEFGKSSIIGWVVLAIIIIIALLLIFIKSLRKKVKIFYLNIKKKI